jgi:hypothetical protein
LFEFHTHFDFCYSVANIQLIFDCYLFFLKKLVIFLFLLSFSTKLVAQEESEEQIPFRCEGCGTFWTQAMSMAYDAEYAGTLCGLCGS